MADAKPISCPTCDTHYDTASYCPTCGNKPVPPQKPKPHPTKPEQEGVKAKPSELENVLAEYKAASNALHDLHGNISKQNAIALRRKLRDEGIEPPSQPIAGLSEKEVRMLSDLRQSLIRYRETNQKYHEAKAAYKQFRRENSICTKLKQKLAPTRKNLPTRSKQSSEVRAILGVIDNTYLRFSQFPVYQHIQTMLENTVAADPLRVAEVVREGERGTPEEIVYTWIANISGDLLESGQYHIYRATLNPMTGGPDLLKIFIASINELVRLGNIDPNYAQEQIAGLQSNIKSIG